MIPCELEVRPMTTQCERGERQAHQPVLRTRQDSRHHIFPFGLEALIVGLGRILLGDLSVWEEGRTNVRHVGAIAEVEVLEVGASSSDRREPAVRHGVAR